VRRGLLAYRNYRLATYDIILRLEAYPKLADAELQNKAFLVGGAAALTLYAKSLRLQQLVEPTPLLQAKLNEPEPKYELAAGFFDEVIAGYSSLTNYGLLLRAMWFWSRNRRAIRKLALSEPDVWGWLESVITEQRPAVQHRLADILGSRLRGGVGSFWKAAFRPAQKVGDEVRSSLGTRFASAYLYPTAHRSVPPETLDRLRGLLEPGDVLLTRTEGKLTGSILPGFWAHAAFFIGNGSPPWDNRETAQGDPKDPRDFVIEAVSPRVRIVPLVTCLDADHVVVLRPQLSQKEIAAAVAEALAHQDKPYDFEFDFNVSSRIVCTELIYRSLHGRDGLEFKLIKRLGRYTLSGDDLLYQAIDEMKAGARDEAGLKPLVLVLRRKAGLTFIEDPVRMLTLLRRIRVGWRPLAERRTRKRR
jgi:hypothetical protein